MSPPPPPEFSWDSMRLGLGNFLNLPCVFNCAPQLPGWLVKMQSAGLDLLDQERNLGNGIFNQFLLLRLLA